MRSVWAWSGGRSHVCSKVSSCGVRTMKSDAIIKVRFFTPKENGRTTSIEGQFYTSPLFFDSEGFDCRLILDGRKLELGITYEVPVKFLYRDLVFQKLAVGKEVLLWEGRYIARDQVVKIINQES